MCVCVCLCWEGGDGGCSDSDRLTFWLELFSRGLELYAGMEAEAIAQGVLLPQALAKKRKTKHKNISFVQFINHTKLTAHS